MFSRRYPRAYVLACAMLLTGVMSATAGASPLFPTDTLDGPWDRSVAPRAASEGADAPYTVVAHGLRNPRGLTIGRDGTVYVAESGRGGSSCQDTDFGEVCTGLTGSVTAIDEAGQRRVLLGLPSYAERAGFAANGPHDVAVRGKRVAVTVGLGDTPRFRRELGPQMGLLGHVVTLRADETLHARDLARHTARVNADGGGRDSNPHGIVWTRRGKFVTDAGGNSLARMTAHKRTKTVAVFPRREVDIPEEFGGGTIPMDPVPTAVVKGHGRSLYVGTFTGFPFPQGGARVYRVVPGQRPRVVYRSLTAVIDMAVGPDGSLYLVEFVTAGLLAANPEDPSTLGGRIVRIAPDGTRSTIGEGSLVVPGGVAVANNGDVYVSNLSVLPDGQVVRFDAE